MSADLYQVLTEQFQRSGVTIDAAEAHGFLCGCLAVDGRSSVLGTYLRELLPQVNLKTEDAGARLLNALMLQTDRDFSDAGMAFQLLLPSDESSLEVRLQALSHWCEGFITGFGMVMGLTARSRIPDTVKEFVDDLGEIRRVQSVGMDVETAEQDWTELVEYVRIGVQLAWEEGRTFSAGTVSGSGQPKIH